MLYNQALLLSLYLKTNSIKPDPYFTRVATITSEFILSEMQDSKGGFYSALDADTNGEEGRYYLWHIDEWNKTLNIEEHQLFTKLFDIDEYGEAIDGRNVLYLSSSYSEYADEKKMNINDLLKQFDNARSKLLTARNNRIKPKIDDKIIMGWNSLTISALAESSFASYDIGHKL